ncbi:MAG: ABC transporter permease [Oscillospiraceae bacterium]|nr:ABC transporter permease [Oscillospiraceae bacterium]
MKNGILTIFKKELMRFFSDRRLVISVLIPGILIYVMYSFMGTALSDLTGVDEDYVPTIQAVNLPESIGSLCESAELSVEIVDSDEIENCKTDIRDKSLDLLIVFPNDFDSSVKAYLTSVDFTAPNIEIYYNSASTESQSAYMTVTALLDAYESQIANVFDINNSDDTYDMATEADTVAMLFAAMLPLLLMTMLYSGCSAVVPESIAGEKERGTIATMLVTPIKRSDIAVGKILALAVIAMISAASSTLGTVLSLPKMMSEVYDDISVSIYGILDYLMLAVVMISTVLLLVAIVSLISAFAKTTKEAQSLTTPVMMIVMVLGLSGMIENTASQVLTTYLVPLYNSVQCMVGIFSCETFVGGVAVTVAVNGVLTILCVVVLTKMFDSEQVIFSR